MADAPATESKNKVTVSDAGPSRKKISVEVPAEVVDDTLAEALSGIVAEAEVPGFRKGRAPQRLIEKRFGKVLREEAKSRLISAAYAEAVESHNLRVLGEPSADALADIEIEAGKPISFEVEVEVLPEFDLPELEGVKVLKPAVEVPDKLVEDEIERICVNEGSLEQRDEPEPGDYLTGKGRMVDEDGNEHYDIDGAVVRIPTADDDGKGMILGVKVDDFATQLGLPKPGETATVKVKGPENHEVEALRGKDLTVTFEVQRVDRIIPAELADIVARSGAADEDQFRTFIKDRLTQRAEVRQQAVQHQQIAKHLLDSVEMELPERISAGQAERWLERRRLELMYRGADPEQIEASMADLRASSAEASQRELKLFFLLNKAAEQLEVQIEEAEVNGRIVRLAAERGVRPEQMRDELVKSGRIQTVIQQVREHKTLDAILQKAEVEEVSVDDFNSRIAGDAEQIDD